MAVSCSELLDIIFEAQSVRCEGHTRTNDRLGPEQTGIRSTPVLPQ